MKKRSLSLLTRRLNRRMFRESGRSGLGETEKNEDENDNGNQDRLSDHRLGI